MTNENNAVTVAIDSGIAIVRLNRPAAMNAINDALRQGLRRTLRELDAGDACNAIVLTGSALPVPGNAIRCSSVAASTSTTTYG